MDVTRLVSAVSEVFLPSLCLHCGELLRGSDSVLCSRCWSTLVPASGYHCSRCGRPADETLGACLDCRRSPPPQSGTVIWGEYDGVLRAAIVALKYRGRDELASPLARRLSACAAQACWDVDTVTAVPSHPWLRVRRGWPAAQLLAATVASESGLPLKALLRRHGLRRQAGRTRAQRLTMPRKSFSARRGVAGARALLVDDVTTTGTTLRRASAALLGAGAETVFCAVLAYAPDVRRLV